MTNEDEDYNIEDSQVEVEVEVEVEIEVEIEAEAVPDEIKFPKSTPTLEGHTDCIEQKYE